MKNHRRSGWLAVLLGVVASLHRSSGADPGPPAVITSVSITTNSQQRITWSPAAGLDEVKVLSTGDLSVPFAEDTSGAILGYEWLAPMAAPVKFHRLEFTPLSSNALLTAIVLNRLAYGPTPDELERILTGPNASGPEAYIEEQLAPELINETIDFDEPGTNWVYVTATGTATGTNFIMYLDGAGSVYIDDMKLVAGTVPEEGANLLANGDFESPLSPPWLVHSNYANSTISTDVAHSGNSSLRLVALARGTTSSDSFYQPFALATPNANQQFTLSYWYLPGQDNRTLTARLSGSLLSASHSIVSRTPASLFLKLTNSLAALDDLRAWHCLRAVRSRRQLLEVLAQFWDNHFNTQYQKTKDWFDNNQARAVTNQNERAWLAVNLEFREASQWRQVLMNPNGTFYDLLRISAFSPAMVIYLDSVLSSKNTPNENYPRELLELFAMGADNGYLQADINELSKAWTGVRVAKKAPENAGNVFAPPLTDPTNTFGLWVTHFATNSHHTGVKRLFTNNVVAARFGAPYAGQPYSLILSNGGGTNGWRDMEQVITHVANLPYTQEFISVKLCQLFVHENFAYGEFDYTAESLSPEAQLLKDCMAAWRTPADDGRQGNLRAILRVIFNSDLFRSHAAASQKFKTPLEFTVSAIRALRASLGDGQYTADTDGYDIRTPISRMGEMKLFDREEPDGYAETARPWLSTATFAERLRFAQHLLMASNNSLKNSDYGSGGAQNTSDPVRLLKAKLPSSSWNDAGQIVDYFLSLLYPGEGRANLSLDRAAAVRFLNSDDTGAPDSSPFANLAHTSTAYDGRVRGMIALLMTFPRFQEQ
jgi:uncharacterized protein (DUF1800 family)